MDLIIMLLFDISIVLVFSFPPLFFITGNDPFMAIAFLTLPAFILLRIAYACLIRRALKASIGEDAFAFSKKIATTVRNGNHTIVFNYNNGLWKSEINNVSVTFKIKKIVFKKSFILAYVARAIRYPVVSNKIKLGYLAKRKLKCNYSKLCLTVVFVKKHKQRRKTIVVNGITYMSMTSRLITRSPIILLFAGYRATLNSAINEECSIDEKSFVLRTFF